VFWMMRISCHDDSETRVALVGRPSTLKVSREMKVYEGALSIPPSSPPEKKRSLMARPRCMVPRANELSVLLMRFALWSSACGIRSGGLFCASFYRRSVGVTIRKREYTPLVQTAYVLAPVVQIVPEVGGNVTELLVSVNQEVERGTPLFRIDSRPYQYRVDQADANLVEVPENALVLLAAVYAAEGTVSMVDTNLSIAKQRVAAAFQECETAVKSVDEAEKQLGLVESSSARISSLLASGSSSREEYEISLRDVAAQRSKVNEAQNRVRQAESATQISSSQLSFAESSVQEARAERGKAEVMVDPVRTLKRVIENQQQTRINLEKMPSDGTLDLSAREAEIQEIDVSLKRLRQFLEKAMEIDPASVEVHPTVRQAKEGLKQATLDLKRVTVKSHTTEPSWLLCGSQLL
jgi:multidrug resistance efflux pump